MEQTINFIERAKWEDIKHCWQNKGMNLIKYINHEIRTQEKPKTNNF